ncbi:MAG: superoxide dismutase [Alphaproteobacteria bacterium]|nr:superoxide dismutase [Alphaproteobacteria bacterium]OJV46428.1 MAG: superoxide dismutase [Alphaproteobacteria bacterium 43-37]
MIVTLPPLPYELTALEPYISKQTLEFHHGKHHQTYVTNLNNLIQSAPQQYASLEDIIRDTAGKAGQEGIFNNAAQVWNHTFFWNGMKANGGGEPTGDIAALIQRDLGGYEGFKDTFKKTAISQFGSGWGWLVLDENGTLKVTKTGNADLPMIHGQKALLACDVWEHAYYLDYQNRRADFVDAFLNHLINWDFVNQNLAAG